MVPLWISHCYLRMEGQLSYRLQPPINSKTEILLTNKQSQFNINEFGSAETVNRLFWLVSNGKSTTHVDNWIWFGRGKELVERSLIQYQCLWYNKYQCLWYNIGVSDTISLSLIQYQGLWYNISVSDKVFSFKFWDSL